MVRDKEATHAVQNKLSLNPLGEFLSRRLLAFPLGLSYYYLVPEYEYQVHIIHGQAKSSCI
jgi:hypothetical protein